MERMETNFVVMPKDANHYGNVHGGVIMLAVDNLAYSIASRYSRMNVVTARISELNFKNPVKVGDMVLLTSEIIRIGNSSLDVKIGIQGENLHTGEIFEVADALLTMVAIDQSGKPCPIKKI